MRKFLSRTARLVCAVTLFAGCATVGGGSNRISVKTNPAGTFIKVKNAPGGSKVQVKNNPAGMSIKIKGKKNK